MASESQELAAGKSSAPEAGPKAPSADNPKELLASANDASGPARNAWLAFLGLLTYLLVTLAGVSHVDLLLNSPVRLPIINVEIPLFSFVFFAPFLFALVHLGLLVQHVMLAHKYQRFSAVIAGSEEGLAAEHPDRSLVHSYVFSQMLAGPRPPWPLHVLMWLMIFVTFSLLPILVLLYFQIKFLPSHDVATTHAHRIAILLDLLLLLTVRPFIAMPYLMSYGKRLSLGKQSWRWEINYLSLGIAGSLCLVVVSFSLLVATVPQACFWPWEKRSEEHKKECFSIDRMAAQWWPMKVNSAWPSQKREIFALTKWLFEGEFNQTTGMLASPFSRNLIVADKDLVEEHDFEGGETSLQLRGRDLRFAVLDRSDLRYADLFDSDLRGISAHGTRLDYAKIQKAHVQGAILLGAYLRSANFYLAELQGAMLKNAKLHGAILTGNLRSANLAEAELLGADLSDAVMEGANLDSANLQGAKLRGAKLQGANLSYADMQGADLIAADLRGAYLIPACGRFDS